MASTSASPRSPRSRSTRASPQPRPRARSSTAGGGDELASGDAVKVNYVAINGRTGKEFDNSFTSDKPLTLTLSTRMPSCPGFVKGLEGQTGRQPRPRRDPARGRLRPGPGPTWACKKDDTMVFLFDVVAKVPTEVTGTAKTLPKPTCPKLVLDDKKQPVEVREDQQDRQEGPRRAPHVVIEGDGAVITEGQTLTCSTSVRSTPTARSSTSRGPAAPRSFQVAVGQLIKCWDRPARRPEGRQPRRAGVPRRQGIRRRPASGEDIKKATR